MAKHVMTVDDSKTMRDMVTFTLRSAGFQVSEAEDGQKALQALQSTKVDLVITDLNMPKMDGVGLIRALRADPKHRSVPILMLTTESDPAKKSRRPHRRRDRLAGQTVQSAKTGRTCKPGLRLSGHRSGMSGFDHLKTTYFDECAELLEAAYGHLAAIEEGRADDDTVHAIFRSFHSIKGGGGAFGFDRLVGFAHELEAVLDLLRDGRLALAPSVASCCSEAPMR